MSDIEDQRNEEVAQAVEKLSKAINSVYGTSFLAVLNFHLSLESGKSGGRSENFLSMAVKGPRET